jgi:hypothetical protein
MEWPGWPDLSLPDGFWPSLSAGGVLGAIGWPSLRATSITTRIGWPSITGSSVTSRIGWPSVSADVIGSAIGWPDISPSTIREWILGDGGGDSGDNGDGDSGDNGDGGGVTVDDLLGDTGPSVKLFDEVFGNDDGTLTALEAEQAKQVFEEADFTDDPVTFGLPGDEFAGGTSVLSLLIDRLREGGPVDLGGGGEGPLIPASIQTQTQSTGTDTRAVENKLDELNANVRRLAESLSVEGVGQEEIARLSSNGKRQDISDSNPRV